jgi:DNA-binding NtrC family response regulator
MAIANVLLVDDETIFVNVIEKRLKKRDISIVTAFSGSEALDKLSEDERIEVVILDVKMPKMDGIETLARIRKQYPLVEVIMLTAHATIESAIDGMRLGAFDYLMKPCEIEELVGKVEKAAARKRGQEEKILEARMREISLSHA